jgi:predicted nucleic acid-binding protein
MIDIRKLRLYLETTMFNYYFDEDRDGHEDTVRLFEAVGIGKYEGYTSRYVTYELQMSPEPKQSAMLALIEKYNISVLEISEESDHLSSVYIREGIIPVKYGLDCAHIASASVYNLDCVLSFNFQHINKLKTKEMTALVNLREGYKSIIICTPMEVLDYEEQ